MTDSPAADIRRAEELITPVLATSPNSAQAHCVKAQILRAQSRPEDAIFEYETTIALDRNHAQAHGWLGACKLLTGAVDEIIPLDEQAIRLSPRDPDVGSWRSYIGDAHLLQSRLEEAILWLERARSTHSWFHRVHASLAAAYALKGETEQASATLAEARKRSDRYASITRLKTAPGRRWLEAPKIRSLARCHLFRRPPAGRDAGRMTATHKPENRESCHEERKYQTPPAWDAHIASDDNQPPAAKYLNG